MTIEVLHFASLRALLGVASESLDIPGDATAQTVFELIQQRHQRSLQASHYRVAINDCFAQWSDPVQPGDTVAFIPPVTGG
jgi:molybdopterin synthase sulfur carrier subunit